MGPTAMRSSRATPAAARTPSLAAVAFAVLASAVGPSALATVIDVPDDQPTIEAGIAAAGPGDTLLIAPDVYYEHNLVINQAITIVGDPTDPESVTIDGGDLGTIMFIQGSPRFETTLSGLTFTNGSSDAMAGALDVAWCGVVVESCIFRENSTSNRGGAVSLSEAEGELTDCTFESNSAERGGAVDLYYSTAEFSGCEFTANESGLSGGALYSLSLSSASVTACTFEGNTAGGDGGAAYCDGGHADFASCTFSGNDCWVPQNAGGGLYLESLDSGSVTDCTFTNNHAYYAGGLLAKNADTIVLSGNRFERNTADSSAGGAQILAEVWEMSECVFWENTAEEGGALVVKDLVPAPSVGTISRSTFAGDSATREYGGVIYVSSQSQVTIEQTIIAFSQAGMAVRCFSGGSSAATAVASCIYGNDGGDWVGCLVGQEGGNDNLYTDPAFCGLLVGDLELCADSPCLPDNNDANLLIGYHGPGCPACGTPVEDASWGAIKALYR